MNHQEAGIRSAALMVFAFAAATLVSACAPAHRSAGHAGTVEAAAEPPVIEVIQPGQGGDDFQMPAQTNPDAADQKPGNRPNATATPTPTPVPLPPWQPKTPATDPGATPIPGATPTASATPEPPPRTYQTLKLDHSTILYIPMGGVLVSIAVLPEGSEIDVPTDYQLSNMSFINSDGKTERSSTGFIYPIRIKTIAVQADQRKPSIGIDQIAVLNAIVGGLYVGGEINEALFGATGNFPALDAGTPGPGYLAHFLPSGQPKFSFITGVNKRFGERLNKGVDPTSETEAVRTKWRKIYTAIRRMTDRTIETPKTLLMMDRSAARHWSRSYEIDGSIAPNGSWSVAMQTAERHGFKNTPCAEFMSEIVRQAYARAGYNLKDDFNSDLNNELIWSNSAAVENFSRALYKAGWVPWDPMKYRPMIGAIMMEGNAQTPGHTYAAAGEDGRFYIDNASPQGRDLREVSKSIIRSLYTVGVFFLPPGINPKEW